jgi:hypothetical protein
MQRRATAQGQRARNGAKGAAMQRRATVKGQRARNGCDGMLVALPLANLPRMLPQALPV